MIWVFWFISGGIIKFIFDKSINKIQTLFIARTVKLIKYRAEWHQNHPIGYIADFFDWILI